MTAASVNIKDASFTLGLNPPDFDMIVSFDFGGRLIGIYIRENDDLETNYRRGLDNRIVKLVKDASLRNRYIAEIDPQQHNLLLDRCFETVDTVLREVPLKLKERFLLEQAARNGPKQLATQAEQFKAIYGTVPILPPDQYRAVVLQATRGCPFNDCEFCSFYRGCTFQIPDADQFNAHMKAVRKFFGESLRLRTSVFLGDANAVLIPTETLLSRMEQVRREFDIAPSSLAGQELITWHHEHPHGLAGFYGFLDGLSGTHKTLQDYTGLASAGLKRVYIGAESGSDTLLERLRKPSRRNDAIETVHLCKQAGIAVGLIFLAGACADDPALADEHRRLTPELIHQLPLDAHDIVYLSPFVTQQHNTPALPPSVEMELDLLENAIGRRPDGPRVVVYDIRGFIY